MNVPRANHACICIKDNSGNIEELLVTGGVGNPLFYSALDTTEIYSMKYGYWKMGPRLPYPVVGASLVIPQKSEYPKVFLVGACQYNDVEERVGQCNKVLVLTNSSSKEWTEIGSLSKSRIDAAAIFMGSGSFNFFSIKLYSGNTKYV